MTNSELKFYTHHLDPNMKWFPRPGEKCSGDYYVDKVMLLVNWFKFTKKIYDREYYEYIVEMKKEKRVKNKKTGQTTIKSSEIPILDRPKLFWQHLRHEQSKNPFDIEDYVFDDKDTVYSIHKNETGMNSVMPDPENPNITYILRIQYMGPFRLHFSREDPAKDDLANRSYKFLKAVMTQKVRCAPYMGNEIAIEFAKNFVYEGNSILRIPESFHDPSKFDYSLEIAPRIEAWFGIYIAVKELFDGEPVLNFAIIDKLFYNAPKMSLLDYILLIVDPETQNDERRNRRKQQLRNEKLRVSPFQARQIEKWVENLKLKCCEVWDERLNRMTERHLTFLRLSEYNAVEQTIPIPRGRARDAPIDNVPLSRIYEKNRKEIHFPLLPLAIVKSGNREYSVPLEHLEIHEKPSRYKNMIDHAMKYKFLKQTTRKPHIYKQETIKMLEDLGFSDGELNFVERFELCSELKMISLMGKVLKEPNLVNKENKKISMTPVIRGFQEKQLNVVPEKELCCALFVLRAEDEKEPCVSEEDASLFYKTLIDGCEFRSIRIGTHDNSDARSLLYDPEAKRYGFYKEVPLQYGAANFHAAANDAKSMFDRLLDKDQKILLFIVISERSLNAYGYIKEFCDVTLGVASQHITAETVLKALHQMRPESGVKSKRIFYQIALKINGKLGGVNQELDWSENGEMSVEEKEERRKAPLRMYVGIDVTHPTAGSGIDFSIAGIVASINPGGTVYRNMIVTQEECRPGERPMAHGRERTDILEGKFVQLLRIFAEFRDCDLIRTISMIEDEPMLWDMTDADYKNGEKKDSTWHRLESEVGFLKVNRGYTIKKIWVQMVRDYRASKNKNKAVSGSGLEEMTVNEFPFEKEMSFLGNISSNSIPEPCEESTPSVTKRYSSYQRENMMETPKRRRSSEDVKEETDIDKLIKICTMKLLEPEKPTSPHEENSELLVLINDTMKFLTPSQQLDLKLDIGNLCRNAKLQNSKKSASYSSMAEPSRSGFDDYDFDWQKYN
ncbi:CRE-RDE-1 protein [Caenorhabditis remanei]|uniref:CRE-RDE-1 protein n=1 Tax=Caenorhabditis remanei TaxID=31234 RepID=E3NAX2_CAERE|nr:CRE-RDE-1 protein [Caenorhabditis remanei]